MRVEVELRVAAGDMVNRTPQDLALRLKTELATVASIAIRCHPVPKVRDREVDKRLQPLIETAVRKALGAGAAMGKPRFVVRRRGVADWAVQMSSPGFNGRRDRRFIVGVSIQDAPGRGPTVTPWVVLP